jgi:hypothetical protein
MNKWEAQEEPGCLQYQVARCPNQVMLIMLRYQVLMEVPHLRRDRGFLPCLHQCDHRWEVRALTWCSYDNDTL